MRLPLSLAVSFTRKRALCLSLILFQSFLPAAFAGQKSVPPQSYGEENGPISETDTEPGANVSAGTGASENSASENSASEPGSSGDTNTGGGAIKAPGALSGLGLSLPGDNYILPSERILKGSVTASPANSPLLYGSVQSMPPGSKIDMTLQVNLNSELSQKGQEVFAKISKDVTDASGNKVLLPGQWVAHGYVTEVAKQRRSLRNGYVEVKFDKIMSPDGQYEIPFDTKFTTKDNALKAAGKIFVKDTGYVAFGAAAGSVLSVQITGIPVAVATHGYSVAIGAGVGGAYGLFCGLKNKGKICSLYPGDQIKLTTAEPISLPGFNPLNLDSAKPVRHLRGLDFTVDKTKLGHEVVSDDGKARVLNVYFTVQNNTRYDFSPLNLRIVSDHGQTYTPHPGAVMLHLKHVQAGETRSMCVPFLVDAHKHKYWMVLHDLKGQEISRVQVN